MECQDHICLSDCMMPLDSVTTCFILQITLQMLSSSASVMLTIVPDDSIFIYLSKANTDLINA